MGFFDRLIATHQLSSNFADYHILISQEKNSSQILPHSALKKENEVSDKIFSLYLDQFLWGRSQIVKSKFSSYFLFPENQYLLDQVVVSTS
jgi:hypothetical protein